MKPSPTQEDHEALRQFDEVGRNGESAASAAVRPLSVIAGRTLPHSLEAEEGLLGTFLVEEDEGACFKKALDMGIKPESFYDTKHGIVFTALKQIAGRHEPLSIISLAEELKAARQLDSVGGYSFLAQITQRVPTTGHFRLLAHKVKEQAVLREIIRVATTAVEDCYNFSDGLPELVAGIQKRLAIEIESARIPARPLTEFLVPPDDDSTVLLGNRYLCRGDGLVLSSSAGMGKSALVLQAAITFALGRVFMGIKPNGPLRSLIIQAEDSDGDIAEVWVSVCHKLQLTEADRQLVAERVKVVTDRINRGQSFLAELRRQVAASNYDLVWINPIASFMAGDNTTQEATADFFRAGLNGINTPPSFGYVVVQHTTKPATGKDRSDRHWHEVMYDMAGSYDLIGWARAIISLRPTPTYGEFNLVLAKRGIRAGVTKEVPQGVGYRLDAATSIPVRHCTDKMTLPGISRELNVIFWEPRDAEANSDAATPTTAMGRPKTHNFSDFIAIFPTSREKALGFRPLRRAAQDIKPIGTNAFYSLIEDAVRDHRLDVNYSNPAGPAYYVKPAKSPAF